MTEKEFMNNLANSEVDILQQFLDLISELDIAYCIIGGLAVNAYVEPVVSLDLDLVVVADTIDKLKKPAKKMFMIKEFPHSLTLTSSKSDLRIQIQTDPRYQPFIGRAATRKVYFAELIILMVKEIFHSK
jgi:hypothetical protein